MSRLGWPAQSSRTCLAAFRRLLHPYQALELGLQGPAQPDCRGGGRAAAGRGRSKPRLGFEARAGRDGAGHLGC